MTIDQLVNGFVIPKISLAVFFVAAIVALMWAFARCLELAIRRFERWVRDRRITRLKNKLRPFGKPFVVNTEHSVGALCLASDFAVWLDNYQRNVGFDKGKNKPWDKVVVCVPRTFTWVPSEALKRPAHTGTKFEFASVMIDFIEVLTREVVSDMSQDDIVDLLSELTTHDSRLLVPYASNQGERLAVYEVVGERTLDELRKLVVSAVL